MKQAVGRASHRGSSALPWHNSGCTSLPSVSDGRDGAGTRATTRFDCCASSMQLSSVLMQEEEKGKKKASFGICPCKESLDQELDSFLFSKEKRRWLPGPPPIALSIRELVELDNVKRRDPALACLLFLSLALWSWGHTSGICSVFDFRTNPSHNPGEKREGEKAGRRSFFGACWLAGWIGWMARTLNQNQSNPDTSLLARLLDCTLALFLSP